MLSFKEIQKITAEAPDRIRLAKEAEKKEKEEEKGKKIKLTEKAARTSASKLLLQLEEKILESANDGCTKIYFSVAGYSYIRSVSRDFNGPSEDKLSQDKLVAKYLVEMLDKNFSTKIFVEKNTDKEYPDEGGVEYRDTTTIQIKVRWK